MFTALVPKVFYADLAPGLDLFVDALRLDVLHRDDDLVVLQRDAVKLSLVRDAEFAAKDRPELTIETDTIDAVHDDVAARRPDLLHPNLPDVTARAWGAREFALRDATGVGVVVREWTTAGARLAVTGRHD